MDTLTRIFLESSNDFREKLTALFMLRSVNDKINIPSSCNTNCVYTDVYKYNGTTYATLVDESENKEDIDINKICLTDLYKITEELFKIK